MSANQGSSYEVVYVDEVVDDFVPISSDGETEVRFTVLLEPGPLHTVTAIIPPDSEDP